MTAAARRIEAVLFDIGGVVTGSPLEAIARYERDHGLAPRAVNRAILTAGETGAWSRLERGELELDVFHALFEAECRAAGIAVDAGRLMGYIAEAREPRPEMLEAIRRLRSDGRRVGALTNNWRTAAPDPRGLRAHFDVFLESSVLGLRKPDPRIYARACRELGVPPPATAFLDDIGANLKPARALGMATIKVDDPARALAELGALVGLDLLFEFGGRVPSASNGLRQRMGWRGGFDVALTCGERPRRGVDLPRPNRMPAMHAWYPSPGVRSNMECAGCQHDNPPQSNFCLQCGKRLTLTCGACGAALPPGSRFCNSCGTPVGSAAVSPPRVVSPETYMPRHLAEKIMSSKTALEGERKQVTVLFADLKGSMELLADRDPEEARRLLDPVLERMMEAVHHYEGMVNQVMGDGIMALFGAPVAHEDHAVRACYAALRMQRWINLYADELQRGGGPPVQIRVGLNSGEVVVRAIGSDLHMDYTAVGQTTHLAARMEQIARPGSVVLTGDTLELAEGYVQVRRVGPITVKGLESPTEVYELTGVGPARSRLQASAARGLTRFVGRERELQLLGQTLEHAGAGHGQAVAIVGEPGVGKSRLVWEFTRSHRVYGWLVLEAGSLSYGLGTPYLSVIELLKAYLRIQERDDQRQIRERVAGKLLTLDPTLEPLSTPLLALLDVPVDDAAWDALDPPQRRQRTLEAVKRLLLRESQVQPLLLLFEDLHWMDAESQAVLDGLIESLPTAPVLLLVTYRPEYQHVWGSKTYYTQLRIDPLPSQTAEELLTALLGPDETLAPLKRALIERTQGNPFFLEESVQTLAETGVLVGDRGAYQMTGAPEAWQIPATVQAIVAARIDRLSPEDKRLLQAASVLGKDVPFKLLRAIADVPENRLRPGLTRLQDAEFLYERSLFRDLEYTFKHALTHEVAYASVLQDRRRALHARITEAIEALYRDRLTEQIERLAHHAVRGEVWEKAVTYLRRAGAKDLARSAYRVAVTCFEQALAALHPLPDTRQKIERAIDLRLDLRVSLFPLNELTTAWRYLQEAEGLARTLDDPRRLGWVLAYMSGHQWHTGGHADEVPTLAQRVEAIAGRLGDIPLQIAAQYYCSGASHLSGDYRGAERVCRKLMQSLHGQATRERFGLVVSPAVGSRAQLARALAERGVFDEGEAHGQEAIRIAEALDHPFSVVVGCVALAYLKNMRGELSQAARLLERAVDQCREWNITAHAPVAMASLGHVYAWSGRIEEGISYLQQSLIAYESAGIGVWHSLGVEQLGEAYLLADQVENARACADRAVTLARGRGERGYEAWALCLLGEIASHRAPPDVATAVAHYGAALGLAAEREMRPLVAHCHRGLGDLYRRTGNREQAQEHLTTAAAMYREMGMTYWVVRLENGGAVLG